jgi:hypothetical protein
LSFVFSLFPSHFPLFSRPPFHMFSPNDIGWHLPLPRGGRGLFSNINTPVTYFYESENHILSHLPLIWYGISSFYAIRYDNFHFSHRYRYLFALFCPFCKFFTLLTFRCAFIIPLSFFTFQFFPLFLVPFLIFFS